MAGSKLAELYVELAAKGQSAIDAALFKTYTDINQVQKAAGSASAQFKLMVQQDDQLASAKQRLNKQLDVARWGAFGSGVREVGRVFNTFNETLNAAALKIGIASAALTKMVSSASPQIFETFTGSLGLLSAVMGEMVAPAFIELSKIIQRVAFWIESLDPSTKSLIASWITWGVVFGGTAIILVKVTSGVWALVTAMRALYAMSPLGLLALVAGIIGTAAIAGNMAAGAIGGGQAAGGNATAQPLTAQQQAEVALNRDAQRDARAAAQEAADARRTHDAELTRFNSAQTRVIDMRNADSFARMPEGAATGAEVRRTAANAAAAQAWANRTAGQAAPALLAQGGRPALQRGDTFQSQFMGLEQQWRRLQTAGAGMSQLEQERMDIMRRTNALLSGEEPAEHGIFGINRNTRPRNPEGALT